MKEQLILELDEDLVIKLNKEKNPSELIEKLIIDYYNKTSMNIYLDENGNIDFTRGL